MNLNQKSWHAKIYLYTYQSLPNNLCIYFWGLLLAILLTIILGPLSIPGYFFTKKDSYKHLLNSFVISVIFYLILSLLLFALYELLFIPIAYFLNFKIIFTYKDLLSSIISWCFILAGILIHCIFLLIRYIKNKHVKDNILINYIKAKTKGICPLINWENTENNELEIK